ncbi:hypothetical protein PtrSN002B_007075 [Pyrenophora tritici-repentis]|uniref:Uncharacterized protein n=2 Tax=Pyrenophora tritici-repentis TaxID=45151 RepID=A0A2W1DBH6_9PLEO|nr:uncharacterized protein PTRG_04287 [Pyrenophora tritici-repentis Pt-1C-BFP]KAA8619621.1 hypothetical protein PtrV1_06715 [Pyrenophora tritici-repentis]EDU47125.1 conserved hypothetical protein [Pyrenophora tritici-repentis Pt-1C-BFP]KAF7447763.1 hypothetical protein A1F99_071270 [Pyrenophora tritici-repentis]KAF7571459.1 hypothetical protein PtrM4_089590 [Pyrenophora tritici-repentis]KAG9385308.1 hypothetical protein A1F94_004855 [Pyrenophora tritici-repentis]
MAGEARLSVIHPHQLSELTMLLFGIALLLPLVLSKRFADIPKALDCSDPKSAAKVKACAQPIADVTAVVPGSSYIAKIECKDCPYVNREENAVDDKVVGGKVVNGDQILLLNITLAHDNRTILLNNEPLYPLPTIPTPPRFRVVQYPLNLSNADLSGRLLDPESPEWRGLRLSHSPIEFDYLYTTNTAPREREEKDEGIEYWRVAVDVIGKSAGYPGDSAWKFDDREQKMLWILVKGLPVKTEKSSSGRDNKAADPFGHVGTDKTYEYQIIHMRLVDRVYNFLAKTPLTLWGRIGHFLGNDVWEVDGGRFLYIEEEWGNYGKKGTLRDMFGEFVYWHSWYLIWIILSSILGGLVTSFGMYKFAKWILAQRELMKWDGMENVWENMRRERIAEEEGVLLNGEWAYRDDPDEGGSSSQPPAYAEAMKPLPSKPLPEKPLPEVPLIDA